MRHGAAPHTYVLRGALCTLHVVPRGDAPPSHAVRGRLLDLLFVLDQPSNAREKERLLGALGLPRMRPGAADVAERMRTQDRLLDAIDRAWTIYRVEHRRVVVPLEIDEEVLGPEPEPTAWIEIELVDEGGQPVAGVDYRVECPDGRTRTGTTNLSGRSREEGLVAGECKVTFPRIDSLNWSKVA